MGEDAARRLQTGRHEESRPIDCMEPQDVLADNVKIGGPESGKFQTLGIRIAGCSDVIGQRVEPYIDHMVRVARNRDPPAETRSRDRQIAEAGLDEADDLIASAAWRYRFGVGLVISQ